MGIRLFAFRFTTTTAQRKLFRFPAYEPGGLPQFRYRLAARFELRLIAEFRRQSRDPRWRGCRLHHRRRPDLSTQRRWASMDHGRRRYEPL